MRTAGIALTLFAAALLIPRAVQLVKRRLHDRADAALVTELLRVTAQRDRYHGLYTDAVKVNAALLAQVEVASDIRDQVERESARLDVEIFDLLTGETGGAL